MDIQEVSFQELWDTPYFSGACKLYEEECRLLELPECSPQLDMYLAMEKAGVLNCYRAMDSETLAGFIIILTVLNPHHGKKVTCTESIYVLKEYRSSGAGLKLLRAAENKAKELGSMAFAVNAPEGSTLHEVLKKSKFRLSHVSYTKVF